MSRVFSLGPKPVPRPAAAAAPPPEAQAGCVAPALPAAPVNDAQPSASAPPPPPSAPGISAALRRRRRAATFAHASTQELIDELRAIAGNDGERVNTVEGRETAAEYSRRVKASVAEREAHEEAELRTALEKAGQLDLSTGTGCQDAAQLLCAALANGVITNSLAVAAAIIRQILADEPRPSVPSGGDAPVSAEEAGAHEDASFRELEKAAQTFLADGHPAGSESMRARACVIMWLGAVFLNVFVSANWTGPPLKDLVVSPLPWHARIKAGASSVVGKGGKASAGCESGVQDALETCRYEFVGGISARYISAYKSAQYPRIIVVEARGATRGATCLEQVQSHSIFNSNQQYTWLKRCRLERPQRLG